MTATGGGTTTVTTGGASGAHLGCPRLAVRALETRRCAEVPGSAGANSHASAAQGLAPAAASC